MLDTNLVFELANKAIEPLSEPMNLINKNGLSKESCRNLLLVLPGYISQVNDNYIGLLCEEFKAKQTLKENYNNCYLNPTMDKQKPTAADLTSYAENQTLEDESKVTVYQMASKVVANKIEMAKKLLSEIELIYSNGIDCNCSKQTLNE